MAHARPGPHAEHLRHVVERAVERARAFAHRDGGDRQLVERHRQDRGSFGEAGPHIGEHDDHQRRQVEQHDQPRVAEPVGDARAAHGQPDRRADEHRQEERHCDARERGAEVEGERAGAGLVDDRERHGLRVRQQARAGELRARVPGGDEQDERDKPQRQVHSPGR